MHLIQCRPGSLHLVYLKNLAQNRILMSSVCLIKWLLSISLDIVGQWCTYTDLCVHVHTIYLVSVASKERVNVCIYICLLIKLVCLALTLCVCVLFSNGDTHHHLEMCTYLSIMCLPKEIME